MTTEPIRPTPRPAWPVSDADAATEILRKLTADRFEPPPPCRADGAAARNGRRRFCREAAMWF